MKKVSLSLIVLLFCLTAFSQSSVIKLEPTIAQDYLVLDKANNPNVDRWEITTFKRTYNPDGTFADQMLDQATLNGKNYKKIPRERLRETNNARQFVTIAGFTSANIKIIEETKRISRGGRNTPPFIQGCNGCVSYVPVCKWKCNGRGYAWEIEMASHPNGGSSILNLYSTFDYYDDVNNVAIPYYQYVSDDDFASFYPGFSDDGINIIRIDNVPFTSQDYFDISNDRLWGVVWGVAKTLGPWDGSEIQTPPLLIQPYQCGDPRSFALNALNIYGDFTRNGLPDYDPVICESANGFVDFDGINGGCSEELQAFDFFSDGDIFDLLDILETCESDDDGGVSDWWDFVEGVKIIRVDDDGTTQPIAINVAKLFNSNAGGNSNSSNGNNNDKKQGNGKLNAPEFEMPPGLYTIGLRMKDGRYLPIVKEVLQTVTNKMKQSTAFDAMIFPSPITADKFEITMKADAKARIDYSLVDFYGNEIYKKTFALQKDLEVTRSIKPLKAMPTGMLMHRFAFEDGSVKVIQTLRD